MKARWLTNLMVVMLGYVSASGLYAQTPLTAAFTYQGQLKHAGSPLNDTADFRFVLFDAETGGNQVSSILTASNVDVIDGLFTVELDFGVDVFNGDARWMLIGVRSPAGGGSYTWLSPPQPLTAVPYATQTRGIYVDASENVGIGTVSPAEKLHVTGGDARIDGSLLLRDDNENLGVRVAPDHDLDNGGGIELYNDGGIETVELVADEDGVSGGQLTLRTSTGAPTIELDAEYGLGGGAHLALHGDTGISTLFAEGFSTLTTGATLRIHNWQTDEGVAGYLTNQSGSPTVQIENFGAGEALRLQTNGGGDIIVARDATLEQDQFWVDGGGNTHTRDLQVHGDIMVDPPRQTSLHIPAYACHRANPDDEDRFIKNAGYGNIASGTAPYDVQLLAPLYLPEGATLEEIWVYYYDHEEGGDLDVTVELSRRDLQAPWWIIMGGVTASTTATSSMILSSYTNEISGTTVDPGCQYTLRVTWNQEVISDYLRLYGCRVVYTVTTLEP